MHFNFTNIHDKDPSKFFRDSLTFLKILDVSDNCLEYWHQISDIQHPFIQKNFKGYFEMFSYCGHHDVDQLCLLEKGVRFLTLDILNQTQA